MTNRSRVFAITRTKYPVLKRVTDDGAGDVMMPSVNFGAFIQRKRDSKKVPDPRMVGYMGYSPMVSAFNLGDAGLYVAAHDGAQTSSSCSSTCGYHITFQPFPASRN